MSVQIWLNLTARGSWNCAFNFSSNSLHFPSVYDLIPLDQPVAIVGKFGVPRETSPSIPAFFFTSRAASAISS